MWLEPRSTVFTITREQVKDQANWTQALRVLLIQKGIADSIDGPFDIYISVLTGQSLLFPLPIIHTDPTLSESQQKSPPHNLSNSRTTYLIKMPLKYAIHAHVQINATLPYAYIFTKSYTFSSSIFCLSSTFLTRPTPINHLNHRTKNRNTHHRHPKDNASSRCIRLPTARTKFHIA